MRWAMLLMLVAANSTWAQSPGLTPEEKREGWVLLFDGKTTFGWTTNKSVKADDGKLKFGGGASATFDVKLPGDCTLTVDGDGTLAYRVGKIKGLIEGIKHIPLGDDDPATLILSVALEGTVRTVKMRPHTMKSLFNGDDLNGWTVFAGPGKKSKFEVKDGELQILDGPGDLQTVAKYRNFILQLECKSNGKHLNSGVFFRCRANEYQNGYECQIQNGFGKEKDYDVDVFDPMSHKLIEKRKVKSGAIDFGTGAIYRRVPARSEVAKDHEWFTMTVLAVDNHFATWVDGLQQVDWTDNRPPSDNARTGYRSEAGHISLQGHDPTTNLSFRNIRIQELP